MMEEDKIIHNKIDYKIQLIDYDPIQKSFYFTIEGTDSEIFTGDIISYLDDEIKVKSTVRDKSKNITRIVASK